MATVEAAEPVVRATLIGDLRAAGKLLGKLFALDDGRRVVELVCRGRGCAGLCYFDVETGEAVQLDRLPLFVDRGQKRILPPNWLRSGKYATASPRAQ